MGTMEFKSLVEKAVNDLREEYPKVEIKLEYSPLGHYKVSFICNGKTRARTIDESIMTMISPKGYLEWLLHKECVTVYGG